MARLTDIHERYADSGQLLDDALDWAQSNPDELIAAFTQTAAHDVALARFAHQEVVDHTLAAAGL